MPAKIGQVRRNWERHREKYVAIAEAVCREDRERAGRLHDNLLKGSIDTDLIAAQYMQLSAAGERALVGRIASDNNADTATIHRHLLKAKASGRWPRLRYPRREALRAARPDSENR